MIKIFISMFIIMILTNIIMKLTILISLKKKMEMFKMSPFECGFEPMTQARLPFSIQFFLITIIFLIFDVEITLILPTLKTFYSSNMLIWNMSSELIFIILMIGLIYEWQQGSLNWIE